MAGLKFAERLLNILIIPDFKIPFSSTVISGSVPFDYIQREVFVYNCACEGVGVITYLLNPGSVFF